MLPPNPDLQTIIPMLLSAIGEKNHGLVIALAVLGIVALARRYGSKVLPFLGTSRGGVALSLVSAIGLSVFAAASAEGSHSLAEVLKTALMSAAMSSGVWSLLKNLAFPSGSQVAEELKAAEPKVEEAKAQEVAKSDASATDILKSLDK